MEEPTIDDVVESGDTASGAPWSQIWHMPALILGVMVFGVGIYLAAPEREEAKFAAVLDEAAQFIAARNLDGAERHLKARLEPYIHLAAREDQARYQMLWGDLVYLQQKENKWDRAENHQKILRHYRRVEELGQDLDGRHLQRLAESEAALGHEDRALAVIDRLKDQPAKRRYLVVREIIERRTRAGVTASELAPLLARFEEEIRDEEDAPIRRTEQIWAVSQRVAGHLSENAPDLAIRYLQRRMISLMAEGGDADLAPLRVLLGRAHHLLDQYGEAQRWYRLAQQGLAQTDPLNADILVGLAQIDLAETGDVRAALESFSRAANEYPTSKMYLEALVGRADCEARLGAYPESIEHFSEAVFRLSETQGENTGRIGFLRDTIYSHFELRSTREEYDLALEYLSVLRPLYAAGLPAQVLLDFAMTHERLADQRMEDAEFSAADSTDQPSPTPTGESLANSEGIERQMSSSGDRPNGIEAAKRAAYLDAAIHYAKSGDFYLEHARVVGASDAEGMGRSLWMAAWLYDKAQAWDRAIEVYAEFIKSRGDDPRQLRAINRLGLAYQSRGQYAAAAELFKQLVNENPRSPESYDSLVPLARCHAALGDVDPAIRVLRHVVEEHDALTPDSPPYREALIELGKLYQHQGMFEEAIETLDESVERFGQSPEGPTLRFDLADAYRQSVEVLDQTLANPLSQSKRLALLAERARRLEVAQTLFNDVIEELEGIDKKALTLLQTESLRNAYFYRADSAYDLGRFEQAIQLYDLAAKRWETHPASLVALVQIVNAYCELGRVQEARVANDRARWQFNRIPDSAFDDPSLPMKREHWQDWLRWTSELELFNPSPQPSGSEARATP